MSICLVGKSCSGKDTVARELVKLGYEKILTYTTRPQRPSELDGVDYHFITENEFKDMIKNKEFQEKLEELKSQSKNQVIKQNIAQNKQNG